MIFKTLRKMLVSAVVAFFKHQLVTNVVILLCRQDVVEQIKIHRQLTEHGMKATFSCDPQILDKVVHHQFQGVFYFVGYNLDQDLMGKLKPQHFSHWYKWLVIGDELPIYFNSIRYDSDMIFLKRKLNESSLLADDPKFLSFEDVFVHPSEGATLHPWGHWNNTHGLTVSHSNIRISRRLNFKQHPLTIISTTGRYSADSYNGTFTEYLRQSANPEQDSAIRCGYLSSSLILEALNASEILLASSSWSSQTNNQSMVRLVETGAADITGAVLRIMPTRIKTMDYILPIWPFSVGFTYLAERESSSNMYVEPFTKGVWLCCLGIAVVLAIVQRITATTQAEKEGAYIGVLATWMQQDAGAVPEGLSGRWSFMVMSTSAMLVHAYYTSAIVSALMSAGKGGPESLRALADSKYAIASEGVEYMRYVFWENKTDWEDLEYLKKKKMTTKLYQDIEKGSQLISDGNTAYHTEYNQIYSHFKTFSDDKVCKLQYIDTVPEQLTWTTATKRSQYSDVFRSRGAWIRETGLGHRVVSRLRMRPPECRASLLAERVKFGDVTPLLATTTLGAALAFLILALEIMISKAKGKQKTVARNSAVSEIALVEGDDLFEYVD